MRRAVSNVAIIFVLCLAGGLRGGWLVLDWLGRVFVMFDAESTYNRLLDWMATHPRIAVDYGPWILLLGGIVSLAWVNYNVIIALFRRIGLLSDLRGQESGSDMTNIGRRERRRRQKIVRSLIARWSSEHKGTEAQVPWVNNQLTLLGEPWRWFPASEPSAPAKVPPTNMGGPSISGISLMGPGPTSEMGGINIDDSEGVAMRNVGVRNFGGIGISGRRARNLSMDDVQIETGQPPIVPNKDKP